MEPLGVRKQPNVLASRCSWFLYFTVYFSLRSVVYHLIQLHVSVRPYYHKACVTSLFTALLLHTVLKIHWLKLRLKLNLLGWSRIKCCKRYASLLASISQRAWTVLVNLSDVCFTDCTPCKQRFWTCHPTFCFWRCLRLASIFRTADSVQTHGLKCTSVSEQYSEYFIYQKIRPLIL